MRPGVHVISSVTGTGLCVIGINQYMSQTSGLALIGLELRLSGRPCPRCARRSVVCACARARCVGNRRLTRHTE